MYIGMIAKSPINHVISYVNVLSGPINKSVYLRYISIGYENNANNLGDFSNCE